VFAWPKKKDDSVLSRLRANRKGDNQIKFNDLENYSRNRKYKLSIYEEVDQVIYI